METNTAIKSAKEILKSDDDFVTTLSEIEEALIIERMEIYAAQFQSSSAGIKDKKIIETLRNALVNLYPHCHEENMKGESVYERAWLDCEDAIHLATKYLSNQDAGIEEGQEKWVLTGRITNHIGYTPTDKVTLTIDIFGQENIFNNQFKIGDEIEITKH